MLDKRILYFLEAAQCLNFSNAARKCFISQQAITWHISNLEAELGVRLFHRTTRSVQLTEAGMYLRDQYSRINEEIMEAENHVKAMEKANRSVINLGIFQSFSHHRIILPIMNLLAEKYPEVYFNYQLLSLDELLNQLYDHRLDMILTTSFTWRSWDHIQTLPLRRFPFRIVVSASHPAIADGISTEILSGMSLLTNEQPRQYNSDSAMQSMPSWRQNIPHKDYIHLPDMNSLILSLELQKGFALLTDELEGVSGNPALSFFELAQVSESLRDAGSDMICCYAKGSGNRMLPDIARLTQKLFQE